MVRRFDDMRYEYDEIRYDDEERLTCSSPGQVLRILWKTCACCSDAQNSCKCCTNGKYNWHSCWYQAYCCSHIQYWCLLSLTHLTKWMFNYSLQKTFALNSPDKMDVSCHWFLLVILKVWGEKFINSSCTKYYIFLCIILIIITICIILVIFSLLITICIIFDHHHHTHQGQLRALH